MPPHTNPPWLIPVSHSRTRTRTPRALLTASYETGDASLLHEASATLHGAVDAEVANKMILNGEVKALSAVSEATHPILPTFCFVFPSCRVLFRKQCIA